MTIGQSFEEAVAAAERARTAPPPDSFEFDDADIQEAEQQALDDLLDRKGVDELVIEAIAESDHLAGMLASLCCAPEPDEARIGKEVRLVVRQYLLDMVSNKVDDILQGIREDRKEGL